MYNVVFNKISTYKSWLVANYQAIVKLNSFQPGLRLVSLDHDKKSGEMFFIVQITGKNVFPKLYLSAFKDASLLSNFNKTDQEIIFNHYQSKQQHATKCIVARTYDREKKLFVYTVEYYDKVNNIKKYVILNELSSLSADLQHFDDTDIFLIRQELEKAKLN